MNVLCTWLRHTVLLATVHRYLIVPTHFNTFLELMVPDALSGVLQYLTRVMHWLRQRCLDRSTLLRLERLLASKV